MPDRRQWRAGAIQGLLLPAAGTGGACWAEQTLPSGTTALLVPPVQPEMAAAAFDRILGDSTLADRLGQNARVLSAELSWDNRAAKISRFLTQRLEEIGKSAGSRA